MTDFAQLIDILEHDHLYDDQKIIETIDALLLHHNNAENKRRIFDAVISIKWNENKKEHGIPCQYSYTVGDPPYASIYADVVSYYGFWQAQKMFGKAKQPYLLDENGEVPK